MLREMDPGRDAAFTLELLNTPKFVKYIGDRGVRSLADAAVFIDTRYRQSYLDHGFGLYAVELKPGGDLEGGSASLSGPIGICGFVRRDTLPAPDIGFAFLPRYEGKGYGTESAAATLDYGRDVLEFKRVLAITTQDNEPSGRILEKIGFRFERLMKMPDTGETLKLFAIEF